MAKISGRFQPPSGPTSQAGTGGGLGSVPFTPGGSYGGSNLGIIVPPGGFAGFGQQTPATQALFQRAGARGGRRSAATRRRKRKATRAAAPRRKKRSAGKRRARLVKGSAAAKRHMARLRRRRRR
jgi:hypothetical protein